jgi:CopA family copper-resistance protein
VGYHRNRTQPAINYNNLSRSLITPKFEIVARMKKFLALLFCMCFITTTFAADHVVNLVVGYKTVYFAGKPKTAIAVNDQIPAPTLHFKEGDHVTINVYNKLNQETALHWHGIIVPWQMDGVLGVNQQGIPPGGVFHYKFTLHQSGTYWYHAHAGLQEQQGLYGAFIIDPLKKESYKYTKDYTIVLSDWSNTTPEKILDNLKKEGGYYSPNFPLQPSLVKFIHDYHKASKEERQQLISDYKMMQQMRMSIYDMSDVAYDAFLLNGQPNSNPWTAPVKIGDVVRLRFIGAGGSSIFHVKIPDTTLQMIHVEGNDIKPYGISDFTIAPGETYDVLVKIKKNSPYIIYAESMDTVGAAYGALVTSPDQAINYKGVKPFPEPLPVTRTMMSMMMSNMKRGVLPATPAMDMSNNTPMNHSMNMGNTMPMNHSMDMSSNTPMNHSMNMSSNTPMNHSMDMSSNTSMNHSMDMNMPTEPAIIGDSISPPSSNYATTSGTKYENLTATVKTNDPNKPVAGVINMELFGYMDRYIWFINGVPEDKAHPIILEPGKRYRFVFTNTSMMHHPMHIHGHWFILREGKGAYDPLLHTIDVAPGATITADVDTDASGQWIFHCHLLYHMMSGMARTFQYSTLLEITQDKATPQDMIQQTPYHNRPIVRVDEALPIDTSLIKHPMAHPDSLWLANFFDIGVNPITNDQKATFKGLYGSDYNKLELFSNDGEIRNGKVENADMDFFYWHLLDQFWAIKGGANYVYRPTQTPYWQPGIGIEGLMPYFIDTDIRTYYHSGSEKVDLELSRDTQITNNFFIRAGVRSILASKTVPEAEIGDGLNQMRYIVRPYYRLMPGLDIFAEFEHEQNYGTFKNLQTVDGEPATQNTLTFGVAIVF